MGNDFSIPSIFPPGGLFPPAPAEPVFVASNKESSNGLVVADAFACGPGCSVLVDSTVTSSSLVLSRDILGKLEVLPVDEGAPSDEWEWDPSFKFVDGKPVWETAGSNNWNGKNWTGGAHYKRANPAGIGRDGFDADGYRWANWKNGKSDSDVWAAEDIAAWKKDQDAHAKTLGGIIKQVRIWNPSDNDMVQLNTDTHGALTKLFLKPTLPFKVSFNDGLGDTSNLNVTLISVFHPCPIRIETIQYDAVIQIGDFHGLNGTQCEQEEDTSSTAMRSLAKKKAILQRKINAEQTKQNAATAKMNSFEYLDMDQSTRDMYLNQSSAAFAAGLKFTQQMDALRLPSRRVCTPKDGAADKLVIFIPLKINDSARSAVQVAETKFVNTFANKIPSILNAQPDRLLGYPDVPAATQNDWKLSDILNPNDCYFTWKLTPQGQSVPTTVVFMKNPVSILSADMGSIRRLPITPPADVFHANPVDVRFHSCPPKNEDGTIAPCAIKNLDGTTTCPNAPKPAPLIPSAAAMADANGPLVNGPSFLVILLGIVGALAVVIGVWLGLKAAMGPGGDALKSAGDWLGRTFAGGYEQIRKLPVPKLPSRSGIANTLGLGSRSSIPRAAAQVQRTRRGRLERAQARAQRARVPIRSVEEIAQAPPPQGTPAALGNIAPVNIPEPSGNASFANPGYANKQAFIDSRTRRKIPAEKQPPRRPVQQTKVADIFKGTNPMRSVQQIARAPPPNGTPAKIANSPAPDPAAGVGIINPAPTSQPKRKAIAVEPEDGKESTEGEEEQAKEAAKVARPGLPRLTSAERAKREATQKQRRKEQRANAAKKGSTLQMETNSKIKPAAPESKPIGSPQGPLGKLFQQALPNKKPATSLQTANWKPNAGKRKRRNRLKTGRKV